jgi:Holliday junction resolvase
MLEAALTRRVCEHLRKHGAYVLKVHGSAWQRAGVPDLLCCVDGRFVGLELKVKPNKPSPLQLHEISKIERSGGAAAVIYTTEELADFLSQLA